MRAGEGAALVAALTLRLDRIGDLARAADTCPARHPDAVREKLRAAIALVMESGRLDENSDASGGDAAWRPRPTSARNWTVSTPMSRRARKLLAEGGAVGRRLDFLAQEFGRETNTLCAKSNDAALTAIGLELKVEVEQLREQAQNIE